MTLPKDTEIKKNKHQKWILIGIMLIIIISSFAFRFITTQKQISEHRDSMQKQTELMIKHWEEEGLSDEQIEKELEELRQEKSNSGERGSGMGFFRIFRGSR